jgi:hypothetical protein
MKKKRDTKPTSTTAEPPDHEGARDKDIGDRTGPAAGYDEEPEQVKDKGGVADS